MTADIEALQKEMRMTTERHRQGQDAKMAHMNAINYRKPKMKDEIAERELRMEMQMHDMCSQIQSLSSALQKK